MLLSIVLPAVLYVVSFSLGQNGEDIEGALTHVEVEQEKNGESTSEVVVEQSGRHTSETVTESSTDSSSSVVVEEGESSVTINIDDNSTTSYSGPSGNENSGSLSDYHYPGASISSESSGEMVMKTGDGAATVTSWYENNIRDKGMNTQSFVRTNSNGNVLNKLGAGGNGENVLIEISAQNGSSETTITVTRR